MVNSTLRHHSHSSKSDDLVFALSICLVVIETLGLLCNGIIITVYYKYSRLRTATNLLILNLAVCNLFQAALQLFLSTPSFFSKEWLYRHSGCIAYGFLHHYLITVAVVTFAIIAFDRFCVITKPTRKLQTFIVTKTRAKVLIFISHVYSFVFTFPLLVGWSDLSPDKHYHTGCSIHYSKRSSNSLSYAIVSTIFTCLIPLIITSCCYAKIYKSVRKSSRRCTMYRSKRTTVYRDSGVKTNSLYHTRTARMITVVMFFVLLTWLPTRFIGLLSAFGCSVSPLAVYICVFLAKSCVMYNAVVYVFLNHRFRAAFLHLTFVCREESRLRFTTDATNASVRNFGEILPSVVEINDRSRVVSRKTLSQIPFIPTAYIPELSSCSARASNTDLSQPTWDLTETPRKDSTCDRDNSSRDRKVSTYDRNMSEALVKDTAAWCHEEVESSCLKTELEKRDLGVAIGFEIESGRSPLPVAKTNNRLTNIVDRLPRTEHESFKINNVQHKENVESQSPVLGRKRSQTFSGSPTEEQNSTKSKSNSNELKNNSTVNVNTKNLTKMKCGFNNPGLQTDDEHFNMKCNDKHNDSYLELNIKTLGNMA